MDSKNFEGYHKLGDALQSQGYFEEASTAYRKAIEIKPSYAWSYHNLGKVLAKQNKFEEAILAQKKAVENKRDFFQAYEHLGKNLEKNNQFEEAVVAYQRVVDIKPGNLGLEKHLNNLFKKVGKQPNISYLKTHEKQTNVKVTFATIVLNEAEFIGKNLKQHYDICDEWIIVEGACRGYPTHRVTEDGLSTDETASIIKKFPDPQGKIRFVQHGWTQATGEDAKSEVRNRYAELAEDGILVVLDADEFYRRHDLSKILEIVAKEKYNCYRLPQLHLWKGTNQIIIGGYWDVAHNRIYSWHGGLRYRSNHNHLETESGKLWHEAGEYMRGHRKLVEVDGAYIHPDPCCFHFGFAKSEANMRDKTDYYVGRGEDTTRPKTTTCREAWFTGIIPDDCKLLPWNGGLPEVFLE